MELENILSVLQDAGIEVDLKILQNPTEEFMIDLVTEYLKKFFFDGNEIAKPTPEQLDCVSCEESVVNAIKAINLHAALATICEGIFLKDLTLTDITSPGCKKACKRIKVLFNFFVYVRNKKMEKEPMFYELENRQKEMEDMVDQKSECLSAIGSVLNEREIKLELKDKLKKEISDLASMLEKDEKIRKKLQESVEEVTAKQQERLNKFNDLRAKAYELHKITKDLQNKIVKSPEEYMSRSKELKNLLEEKMRERQELNDCINRKKTQIRNNESAESEIKKVHLEMVKIGEIVQKLKEKTLQVEAVKRQYEHLKEEIVQFEKNAKHIKNDSDISTPIDLEKSQQLLSELHNSHAEKQREMNALKVKLNELRNERQRMKDLLEKEKAQISNLEMECVKLSKDFKNRFENEISQVCLAKSVFARN